MPKEKTFIHKNNDFGTNIVSILFIIFSLICYQVIIYMLFLKVSDEAKITSTIVNDLHSSEFSLNYLSVKLDDLLYQKTFLIDNNYDISFPLLLNKSINSFLNLTSLIHNNQEKFLSNITDIVSGDVCKYIPQLNSCNKYYQLEYVHLNGLKSIINYYTESVSKALNYFNENNFVIYNVTDLLINQRFSSVRFLIENIQIIYAEIYNQLYYVMRKNQNDELIDVIVIALIFNILYFILIFSKLKSFILNLINEEMLSNRLIGEVPLELIEKNKKLEEALTGAMEVTKIS